MSEQDKPNPSAPAVPVPAKTVKFIHKQGDRLPTYHADGAWGVTNQHGNIRISFYTENIPVPTAAVNPVHPDGSPTGEQELEGVIDPKYFLMIRDFQCNVVLSITSAVQVHQMLGNFIRIAQENMAAQVKVMENQMKEAAEKKPVQ
jgi:hypothetical protein